MVMKKRFFGILLAFLFLFTACSSASYSQKDEAITQDGSTGYGDLNESPQYDETTGTKTSSADTTYVRKIIKDASMALKADDVDKTYADILKYAAQYGGYEFSHDKTVDDTSTYITAVIKIKPEGLDCVMNYVGESVKVISSSVKSDDITSNYYDTQIRLQTVQKTLEKYYQFLSEAKNVTEMLQIQNEINTLTQTIESYEGQLKMWDTLVQESTLTLSIYQINDSIRIDDEVVWNSLSFSDMGSLIKVGFSGVINILLSVLEWMLIILISASPLLVIAVIIILLIRHKSKNKKTPPKSE